MGLLRKRIEDDWDNVVLITGAPGSGKSTLGIRLARAISGARFRPSSVTFSAPQVLARLEAGVKGDSIVYDEAVLGLLSSEYRSPETMALQKASNIVRAKGMTLILCIPDAWDLAKSFRARRADVWIHCRANPRGQGLVHVRDYSPRYRPNSLLPLWRDMVWNPLCWTPMEGAWWDQYMSLKMATIQATLHAMRKELEPGAKGRDVDGEIEAALRANPGERPGDIAARLHVGVGRVYAIRRSLSHTVDRQVS